MQSVSPFFAYREGQLFAEDCPVAELAARHGTPLYVYSRAALQTAYRAYADAIGSRRALVCFGMKANSNLAVLGVFARLGAGFDIVSGGELARVLAAGGDPGKVVFSGVGKSEPDMRAALQAGVLCFNVESTTELERLNRVAGEVGRRAPVSLRVNPDVDAKTHPYISTGLKENKFGIAYEEALQAYRRAAALPHLHITGIDCHIGSQLTDITPYGDALDKVLDLVDQLAAEGIALEHIDLGGGLGIRYNQETPPPAGDLLGAIFQRIDARGHGDKALLLEPGRSLVGNAGALITRVEYLKPGEAKNFAIVDAAMNDLLRPTLYDAWHNLLPVTPRAGARRLYDIVGPICESGDWLARDRELALEEGDLLAIQSAGAYAMAMASNYNTRPRAAEVMVDGAAAYLVRSRESVEELFARESLLPGLATERAARA
jgi:diaminopimelate decarboxylase